MLSVFCFMGASVFAQTIEGGAGVIHVIGDPNLNDDLISVSVNEGNIAYDNNARILYVFDAAGTPYAGSPSAVPGTQWVAVDVSGIVDPVTSILTPETELTATTVGGVTTIEFESDATIAFNAATNILTFTDVDGDPTAVDISGSVDIEANDPSITVSGTGTVADPYQIGLTGAIGATPGTVPVTNGTTGALTWTNVVTGATTNAQGQIVLSFTGGPDVALDLNSVPKVSNITELNAAATALPAGQTGLAIADELNTFGMPATSSVGVLFFISN